MKNRNSIESFFPIYAVEKDLLVSVTDDVSVGYKLKMPQIYSLDQKAMDRIGTIFDKMVRSLPPNTVLQKQDYFFVQDLKDPVSKGVNMLSKSDNNFYFEKPILVHECYLIFTLDSKSNAKITAKEKKFQKFLESIGSFVNKIEASVDFLTSEEYFDAKRLSNDELIELLGKYFSLSQKADHKLKDLSFDKFIEIGDISASVYTITSNNELPINISSTVRHKEYSTQKTNFHVPFIQPVCLGFECNHMYNQVIYIESSDDISSKIRLKQNTFKSAFLLSKENEINYHSLDNLIEQVVENELQFIRQHYNLILWDKNRKVLDKNKSEIENTFRTLGIVPYLVKYSLKDIYLSNCPGAAVKIPKDYTFYGISEQTPSLINFESYYETFKDGILLCDRKNQAPIRLDLWDEPLKRGLIVNRNRLIFGPSGTGKSFLINHIASQYYEQGHHIVMIDIGNSYKKLCDLVGGEYFTYDVNDPLEFNPFYIHSEIDIDKKEFLVALILFLWKGDSAYTREEKQIITLYIDAYYAKLKVKTDIFPKLSTFYEFVMENRVEYNEEKYFDKLSFDLSMRDFYDGKYRHILNSEKPVDLVQERFIVFEMDNIKDHPVLFPLVTMLSIDVVMGKIKKLKGIKKSIFIDECWKPISKGDMAEFIKYLYKTVRKHYGEVAIATQDVEDILDTAAGPAMINNTDTMIMLSHKKKMASKDKFEKHLSFTESDLEKLFSTEKREVFVKVGSISNVYKVSVSKERYACYTSNSNENKFIYEKYNRHNNMSLAIKEFVDNPKK